MADRDLVAERMTKSFPGHGLVLDDVSLEVPGGTSLALLGPSGCGKTTLLRVIAGLEPVESGRVRVGDRQLLDSDARPLIDVPPDRRRIGMVFQDWALFSHLSVTRNVGFGLPRAERRESPRIDESLAMVGMSDYGDRSTDTLSGGQQQRVALARALAPEPQVLLLDEPFSNLDASLRASLRSEVRALLSGLAVTSVFVTHDQEEAFIIGDRIAVMNGGRIVQVGTPVEVYGSPIDRWVASFVGEANFVPATPSERSRPAVVSTPLGYVTLAVDRLGSGRHGNCDVLLRPEDLVLTASTQASAAVHDGRPESLATVVAVEYLGHATRYRLECAGAGLVAIEPGPPRFSQGDTVAVTVAEGTYHSFPSDPV